jgi:hypothetical protein
MAITFTTTQVGANSDYTKFLWKEGYAITKTDRKHETVLLDFALAQSGSGFVKLKRGAYIDISSTIYPHWFTGFVTNDPDLIYLGSKGGLPYWGYRYYAAADEYILSLNPVGIVPTFFNIHMGAIIKSLANRAAPGLFDVTNVADGPLVAQYTVDPTKSFFDVTTDLCGAASYVFYGNNKKLYFKSQDSSTLPATTLDGNSQYFTPSALTITADTTGPVINDVTVVGDIEPQKYVQEYFLGTGLDSSFQLIDSVFGADSSLLIDEMFTGSTIDTSKWIVYDQVATQYLKLNNGYLNSLGGVGNVAGVNIQSVSSLPMEGHLRFTHGEWDFIGGGGVIGSVWTQVPNNAYAGCLYGIAVNGYTLNPVANGSGDGTQTATISSSKRYVIRTIANFSRMNRTSQPYSYIDSAGVVHSVTLASSGADTVVWQTTITEIDPMTGFVTNSWLWTNTCALTGTNDTYATYVPLMSYDLHATVTGITVSTPLAAALATSTTVPLLNADFDLWSGDIYPSGWTGISASGVLREGTIVVEGNALKLTTNGGVTPYAAQYIDPVRQLDPTQPSNNLMLAGTSYNVRVLLRRTSGGSGGNVMVTISGTGVTEVGPSFPVSSIPTTSFQVFTGTLIAPLNAVPSDLAIKVYVSGGTAGQSVYADELAITSAWQLQLVGPNEIDAIDGQAPIATIVQPNGGSSTQSTYTGAPQYNSGQGQLVFFKDSVTRTSNIPPVGQLVRLTYRSAGAAVGRVSNLDSVALEAAGWGDNGIRSVVRGNLSPRPRSAAECELAASSVVAENSYTHYTGTYVQRSNYLSAEPRGGSILKFTNLSSMAAVTAEEINEVVTVLDNGTPESFIHTITFGRPNNIQQLLNSIQKPVGAFLVNQDASSPSAVSLYSVGLNYAPDVTQPNVLSWDDNYIYMDAGQALPFNGVCFEVRYTDDSWGADDGKNLVTRASSRYFSVPRSLRGQMFFIRQVMRSNLLIYSEDQTNSQYTASGVTVTVPMAVNMNGNLSQVSSLVFSGAGYVSAPDPSVGAGCFSLDVKGVVGHTVVISMGPTNKTVTLTGLWQRVSVYDSGGGGAIKLASSIAQTVQTSRWSVEQGVTAETQYSKTNSNYYGPVSRYPAAIHVAFPAPLIAIVPLPTIINVTASSTLPLTTDGTDLIAEINTTAGPVTVTLPPSGGFVGQTITCVLVSQGSGDIGTAYDAIVNAASGDLYSGASTWTLNKQWQGQEFTGTA